MRVGVMGGTFDPIHIGHLIAAEEVRFALSLQRVLFVPAGDPPHKGERRVTGAEHRLRMVELAIGSNQFFELSLIDVRRPGKSYTVELLEILRAELGPAVELYFIIGMDSLAELSTWKEPSRLISQCRLAVVKRPPHVGVDLERLEREVAGVSGRVDLVDTPGIDVASTELRRRVANGLPIKYQVPESVERYIAEVGLYREQRKGNGEEGAGSRRYQGGDGGREELGRVGGGGKRSQPVPGSEQPEQKDADS